MKKLAIIHTHPVQYNSPLFQLLTERDNIEIKVFYTWSQWKDNKLDKAFGRVVEWDVPLLEGYAYQFVENKAAKPGLNFMGIYTPALMVEIKQWGADAVLIYGWSYRSHFRLMQQLKGKTPVFFRGDSHLLDAVPAHKQWLKKAWLSFVYSYIDKAFFVGVNNLEYFKAFGLKHEQLVFAPHAIDNQRFASPHRSDVSSFLSRLGLEPDNIVFLFAGKFEPKKDPALLLRAFQTLRDEKARLIMVGNGVLEKELKKMGSEDKRILFLEFQNQRIIPALYAAADVLVLPSKGPGETWGLAVNEAMAAGKAIIASDKVGSAADLIQEGVNGYTFPAGNYKALSAVLQQLTADKEKTNSMGKASLEIIRNWTFEEIALSIEKTLTENL